MLYFWLYNSIKSILGLFNYSTRNFITSLLCFCLFQCIYQKDCYDYTVLLCFNFKFISVLKRTTMITVLYIKFSQAPFSINKFIYPFSI